MPPLAALFRRAIAERETQNGAAAQASATCEAPGGSKWKRGSRMTDRVTVKREPVEER